MGPKHRRQPSPVQHGSYERRTYHQKQPGPDVLTGGGEVAVDAQRKQDDFPWNTELIEHFGMLEAQIQDMRSKGKGWTTESKKKMDIWIETVNECIKKLEAGTSTLIQEYKKAKRMKITVDQTAFQSKIIRQTGRLRRLKVDKIDQVRNNNELVDKYNTDVLVVTNISYEARKARSRYVDLLRDAMDGKGEKKSKQR